MVRNEVNRIHRCTNRELGRDADLIKDIAKINHGHLCVSTIDNSLSDNIKNDRLRLDFSIDRLQTSALRIVAHSKLFR